MEEVLTQVLVLPDGALLNVVDVFSVEGSTARGLSVEDCGLVQVDYVIIPAYRGDGPVILEALARIHTEEMTQHLLGVLAREGESGKFWVKVISECPRYACALPPTLACPRPLTPAPTPAPRPLGPHYGKYATGMRSGAATAATTSSRSRKELAMNSGFIVLAVGGFISLLAIVLVAHRVLVNTSGSRALPRELSASQELALICDESQSSAE